MTDISIRVIDHTTPNPLMRYVGSAAINAPTKHYLAALVRAGLGLPLHKSSILLNFNLCNCIFIGSSIFNKFIKQAFIPCAAVDTLLLSPFNSFLKARFVLRVTHFITLWLPMVDSLNLASNFIFNKFLIISCLERICGWVQLPHVCKLELVIPSPILICFLEFNG